MHLKKQEIKEETMKWLEIIELRSADNHRELLGSQLQKLIKEVDKETKMLAIKTYSRVRIDTDFSIHLFHDSKKVEKSGSPLGLRLASALKEFGLVNHSIWIEMHGR
jgi:alkyl hydroperoxide reductase subunit AhpF